MEALTHLAVIWAAVLVAVVAARVTRLTPVLYYLAAGCILVNVGILPEETDEFIRGFAEVGIILIMFALGFEESSSNFLQSIKKSWGIALFGALAPFGTAYWLTLQFFSDPNIALMCGLTMTATAVSLTMVSLKSEGLQTSPAATRIMTSAVLDDIASLALVAVLVSMATGAAAPTLGDLVLLVGKVAAFFLLVTAAGAWVLPHNAEGWFARVPVLKHIDLRGVLRLARAEHATLTVLLLALATALLGHVFGFHPAVGAYMAGLILKEEYFELERGTGSYQDTLRIVDNVAYSWIGPVFFVTLGTHLVFERDIFQSILPEVLLLTVALAIAQVVSASVAARYTGGLNRSDSLLVGLGMLGRAELAFVVMDIAYVQNDILSREAFYLLMATAFCLNIMVPLSIRWWKIRYGRPIQQAVHPDRAH